MLCAGSEGADMGEVVVVASPNAGAKAAALAEELAKHGLSARVPDFSATWNRDGRRSVLATLPRDAFIVVCITAGCDKDSELVNLLWQAVPMKEDPTGRFIFAMFDSKAAQGENVAPFLARHFTVKGGNAGEIAEHIRNHQKALAEAIEAEDRRQEAIREAALRQPPSPQRERTGTGSGDIGAAERPMGVGSGGRLEGIGAGSSTEELEWLRRYREIRSSAPAPTPPSRASMPEPQPAAPPAKLDKVDAAAFAPKKLRRGTEELVRVSVFRPKDRSRVMRAVKQADPSSQMAGAGQTLGKVARGAKISAVIDVRGGESDVLRQDAIWTGSPIEFDFGVSPSLDPSVAQALVKIRILADGAQVGAITFVRPLVSVKKPGGRAASDAAEKLRRVDRVFLSYSSADRSTVGLIASAYRRAGIECFFDRSSLKSGEEWSPRLLKEIGRVDLFNLCWSKNAAASPWVERETSFAMNKRGKSGSGRPDITIQMLDGPPWAPHPASLNRLNFDDYARAAIVGYERGDGA
jgi:hypothetical protein